MYPHATEDSTNDRRQADVDDLDARRDEYGEPYDRSADHEGGQHEAAYTSDTEQDRTDPYTDSGTASDSAEPDRADSMTAEHDSTSTTSEYDTADADRADSGTGQYDTTGSDTHYDSTQSGTLDGYDTTESDAARHDAGEPDHVEHDHAGLTTEHDHAADANAVEQERAAGYAEADGLQSDRGAEYAHTGSVEQDRMAEPVGSTDAMTDHDLADRDQTDHDLADRDLAGEPAAAGAATAGAAAAGMAAGEHADQRAPQAVQDEWQLFDDQDRTDLRSRWAEVQGSFVDDPRQALTQAEQLVSELVQSLTDRFHERKAELAVHDSGDTEELRLALRRYRTFFTQVLGG